MPSVSARATSRIRGASKNAKTAQSRPSLRSNRLLLVDDHAIGLAALRLFFATHTDFQVSTLALDRIESLAQASVCRIGLALVNTRMAKLNGGAVAKALLESSPGVRVVGFNGTEDREAVLAMLRAGASGYLMRDCPSRELLHALRTVQGGGLFFSPCILRMMADDYSLNTALKPPDANGSLSERDRKILASIADGRSNKEIAAALGLSVRTAEKYRETLMCTLRIDTVSGLTKYAIRHGLTTLD